MNQTLSCEEAKARWGERIYIHHKSRPIILPKDGTLVCWIEEGDSYKFISPPPCVVTAWAVIEDEDGIWEPTFDLFPSIEWTGYRRRAGT